MAFFRKQSKGPPKKQPKVPPPLAPAPPLNAVIDNFGEGYRTEAKPMKQNYDITSAILAAAIVAKSDLAGKELEDYALTVQRRLLRGMQRFDEKNAATSS